jgi:hypothetical protein
MQTSRAHRDVVAWNFIVAHGEKAALGIALLVVFVILGTTHWLSRLEPTPADLIESALRVERGIQANRWPPEARQHLVVAAAHDGLARVQEPVAASDFAYRVPISPKLYPPQRPAADVDVIAASELRAVAGRFPLARFRTVEVPAVNGSAPANGIEGIALGASTRPPNVTAKPVLRSRRAAVEGTAVEEPLTAEIPDARGVRYVCVVGVVDMHRQWDSLRRALHLETAAQANALLEYVSFRVQRQRAVRDRDPWSGPWQEIGIQNSLELLTTEAAAWEQEPVEPGYVNDVFTSPLPQRLDGNWPTEIVSHPLVPLWIDSVQSPTATLGPSPAVSNRVDRRETVGRILKGFTGLERPTPKHSGTPTTGNATPPGMQSYPGMERASDIDGMPGEGMFHAAARREWQLFRFFDFEVEPEQCYRYRVQLEIFNPNYGAKRVAAPETAQGETRLSPWSEPTPPVAIERDAAGFLARIARRGTVREEADVAMFQWQPGVGTTIHSHVKVKPGAFVGGKAKGTFLDMAAAQLTERELNFRAEEVLVDCVAFASPYDTHRLHGDLRLTKEQWSDLTASGRHDRAITLNRFGEFEILPAESGNSQVREARNRLELERKPFLDRRSDEMLEMVFP